jgi:hypothetical protein
VSGIGRTALGTYSAPALASSFSPIETTAATSPPCLEQKLATCTVRGTGHMTYYYDAATAELEHEFQRLRFKQRHRAEQNGSNQGMTSAIKMLIGDWHVDELGILTREIKARD